MPTDVAEALKTVFRTQGGMTEEEAAACLGEMEKKGRFQQECWA